MTAIESLAAVFVAPGRPLELRSLAVPELGPGEMLVKIAACTICGSDLHSIRGARPLAGPMVLGHEILGTIEAVADAGSNFNVGDRVTWSIMASCGECDFCRRDVPQKCTSLFKYGHEVLSEAVPLSGGLAQHCVLKPGTTVVKLPDELPDLVACPANCATATVTAALRVAGGCTGRTVVIHGAGMLGLTAVAMAVHQQAERVIVTDTSAERLELAREFGAQHTILATPATEIPREIDVVFDMSGSSRAIQQSLDMLGIGGQLILVGSVFPVPEVTFLPEQIVRKLIRIEGVHNYRPRDLVDAVEFLRHTHTRFPFAKLVGRSFPLEDINAAIDEALTGRTIRTAVVMSNHPLPVGEGGRAAAG